MYEQPNEQTFADMLAALLYTFPDVEHETAIYEFSDAICNEHLMETFLEIGGLMDCLNVMRTALACRMVHAEHSKKN